MLADKIKSTSAHTHRKAAEEFIFPTQMGISIWSEERRTLQGGRVRIFARRLGSSVKGQVFGVSKYVLLIAVCRRTNRSAISPDLLILDSQQH